MIKNILKLNGAQKLEKNEQKSISGGMGFPIPGGCPNWHDALLCCYDYVNNCCEGDVVCLS